MSTGNPTSLHGHVGTGLGGFSRLLPADPLQPDEVKLKALAAVDIMGDQPDSPTDFPDPEENLYVPAGYTYFSQFIDHDLTFDTTSSLDITDNKAFTNRRTPAFDLDCVYGTGPDAAPYMYDKGIRLFEGDTPGEDLPRMNKRAVIGDPRNDENSIVCNIQMAFIRFHNKVVDELVARGRAPEGTRMLFEMARNEVRWTYQRIIVDDLLPRIICNEALQAFEVRRDPNQMGLSRNEAAYALFTADRRGAIPLEFSGAAYRFGHSMVRTGYRLNSEFKALIFALPTQPKDSSLVGFEPLPKEHIISDWSLLLPDPNGSSMSSVPGQKDTLNNIGSDAKPEPGRLQYAYRIDTTIVNPLAFLPHAVSGGDGDNLGARNLLRGRKFQLPSGQAIATALGFTPLEAKYLVTRDKKTGGKTAQTYVHIDPELCAKTPLWFYILAEAQSPLVKWWFDQATGTPKSSPPSFSEDQLTAAASATATQLRGVGARIVLEVFHGLLDADSTSYRNHDAAASWNPLIADFRLWNLVNCKFT